MPKHSNVPAPKGATLSAAIPDVKAEVPAPAVVPEAPAKDVKPTPESLAAAKFANEHRTDAQKLDDLNAEARAAEKRQVDAAKDKSKDEPNTPVKAKAQDMYSGPVTCHSTSQNTGEAISFMIHFPEPVTLDGVWNAFKTCQPSAVKDNFKVDPDNTTDPDLRQAKEVAGH